jgi:hypothetical protein
LDAFDNCNEQTGKCKRTNTSPVEETNTSTTALTVFVIPISANVGYKEDHNIVEEDTHKNYHEKPENIKYNLFGVRLSIFDVNGSLMLHAYQCHNPEY